MAKEKLDQEFHNTPDLGPISTPPPPQEHLRFNLRTIPKDFELHRIHSSNRSGGEFNSTNKGNNRFSPIGTSSGAIIPTMYLGNQLTCVLMETVFRTNNASTELRTFDKNHLRQLSHSTLVVSKPLTLVSFESIDLRPLKLQRNQIIDTEASCYAITREWARKVYHQETNAQGICWVSRQDDNSKVMVLFGDRVANEQLTLINTRHDLTMGDSYRQVLDLANRLGITIAPGKMAEDQ